MPFAAILRDLIDEIAPDPGLDARADQLAQHYDLDSSGYDVTNTPRNYLSPRRIARMLLRHLPDPEAPVLDLACGTGLMGKSLYLQGHRNLVGADLSQSMLQTAAGKGIYRQLIRTDLHAPLPFPPESFAAVVCAGAFYEDIVHVRALIHVLPLVRPGGWLACDIDNVAWTGGRFAHALLRIQDLGLLDRLHIEAGRMFAPGYMGPDAPDEPVQGRFILARRAPPDPS